MNILNTYFLTLDIETSTESGSDGKPSDVWLSYGVLILFDSKGTSLKVYRFRTWEELQSILEFYNRINKKCILCYCHNLSYEYDFLIKNISKGKNILANSSHQIIQGQMECYKNIMFRCSYMLSRLSLAKLGNQIGLKKLDSEYRTIYSDDEISSEEWDYCIRDNEIVGKYIAKEVETYKQLSLLPLTSTGKVRRDLKEMYKLSEWDIMPTEDEYNIMLKAFRGGLTMSNPKYTGYIINKKIRCYDEKSKYPSVMLCYEYPYHIKKLDNLENLNINNFKFWIARVTIRHLISKYEWAHLSASTCEYIDRDTELFNGKIINSECITLYITNIDLNTIEMNYWYRSIDFEEFYYSDKSDKLPDVFYELIEKYAKPKSELKKQVKEIEKKFGEHSKEFIDINRQYFEAKANLNGIYGMMVQKLTHDEYTIDDCMNWIIKHGEYKYIKDKHIKQNFLFGVFITSYSRYDLINNIVYNCPENFVYCDTDSIKYIDNDKPFIDQNKPLDDELNKKPWFNGFNMFEEEEGYDRFITYGAKKYCYDRNGIITMTVAGLPKSVIINRIEDFKLNTEFKDCKLAKRYMYNKEYKDINLVDENLIEKGLITSSNGGIALYETSYTLSMTKNDINYIKRNRERWERENIQ